MGKAKKRAATPIGAASGRKKAKARRTAPGGYPAWRFSTVDEGASFAGKLDDAAKVLEMLRKLRAFDGMRWSEIEGRRHHSIPFNALSSEAQKRLRERNFEEDGKIFSFALDGIERLIFIREGGIAKLLWYDPEHLVCPSQKKHT